eukprot:4138984-Karenia_brevis.AAC.1
MTASETARGSLYPDLFLQPIFWQIGIHEDAHEQCFMKLLNSEVSQARQLQAVFRGECTWSLKCPHCFHSA